MTINTKALHGALAALVRGQVQHIAGVDAKVSAAERKKVIASPIKDILESMPKKSLSVDAVVGEVLSRKKALFQSAGVKGATVGFAVLLKLGSEDRAVGDLLVRASHLVDAAELDFASATESERTAALRDEATVKNAEWIEIEDPAQHPALASYLKKALKAARNELPDNDNDMGTGIVMIGEPKLRANVLVSLSGEVLGARVSASQAGGCYRDEVDGEDIPDGVDRDYHFGSEAAAAAAGVDTSADVRWSYGSITVDAKGKVLPSDDNLYWEWTGW